MFPPPDYDAIDSWCTGRAADLAEALVDEISRSRHSWTVIAALASALAEMSARIARLDRSHS